MAIQPGMKAMCLFSNVLYILIEVEEHRQKTKEAYSVSGGAKHMSQSEQSRLWGMEDDGVAIL